jgi:SNF2 family DNA or RNA helicase
VSVELGALKKRLRPYQIQGAEWLLARARNGLGALLADEMGLGKTVQTLATIEALPGTTLVVCPSSLVWNWKREAQHFLPDLSVLSLDGPDREKRFAGIPAHRLVITSYALLRRDIERYKAMTFAAVVLDEAQHIKNPDSQNAKAACALTAQSRFILTGTPVENSLRDLWSLFEFLLPGYLGSRQDFKDRYETPLLNGERGAIWQRLSRRLEPYLMRRRKQEILAELPDKIEQVIEVELSLEQKTAYTQLQQAARAQIDELSDRSSGAARMRVLTALLRLRQACCDLRLLGAQDASSSKLNALLELVGETIDGGHRALIFSQFTAMLDIIAGALEEAGISFCRLDGSTRNRKEVVDRFQNDERIPLFLISLKAGGVGLNLTAADTVIHFDPWWNPAVEAQATDRAHRIGQQRIVTSIKLIARDTVEERVLRMQETKRELLEGTVDAEAALERLSTEDLRELVETIA